MTLANAVASVDMTEFLLGRYEDVLADARPDVVITDPPYLAAERKVGRGKIGGGIRQRDGAGVNAKTKRGPIMPYEPATEQMLRELVRWAAARVRTWVVVFNDFEGVCVLRDEMRRVGLRVSKEPLVWHKAPQFVLPSGNNLMPGKDCEFIAVARIPGSVKSIRERRGIHCGAPGTPSTGQVVTGGKPLGLMRALVRDYSEPGDLIVDPCAGGATTLLAARLEGRRALGAEMDPTRYERGSLRLAQSSMPGVA